MDEGYTVLTLNSAGEKQAAQTGFWMKIMFRLLLLSACLSGVINAKNAWSATLLAADAGNTETAAELALVPLPRLDLDVQVTCEENRVAFRLVNQGADWPQKGTVAIHGIEEGRDITARNLIMKQGQAMSFRVKTGGAQIGPLGLDIHADWVSANDSRQVTVTCP